MKDPKNKCTQCEKAYDPDKLIEFDGKLWCSECIEEETTVCSHCGERIWKYDNAGDSNTPLCEHCYDTHYTSCSRCDRVIHFDNAFYISGEGDDPYCRECYDHCCNDNHIRDYYYKPEPIFYGTSSRFFGVELEVDDGGECDDNAKCITHIANDKSNERIYCKHDGSLEDGFEIVTHPMSLEYHSEVMPWEDILDELKSMNYLSHKAGSCGLHVHVNRDAFGESTAEQDECIGRILYFFEKFWDELLKFSRRTLRQLERWAARYGYKENPRELLDHAKKDYGNGRYSCVNLQNHSTIEFRMFRGTLKYNTLIATLQLIDKICDVALYFNDDEIRQLSWTSFVSGCTEPELVRYLKERRIFVNEPVESEEDI